MQPSRPSPRHVSQEPRWRRQHLAEGFAQQKGCARRECPRPHATNARSLCAEQDLKSLAAAADGATAPLTPRSANASARRLEARLTALRGSRATYTEVPEGAAFERLSVYSCSAVAHAQHCVPLHLQ